MVWFGKQHYAKHFKEQTFLKMINLNIIIRKVGVAIVLFHNCVFAQHVEVYTEILPPFQIMVAKQLVGTATEQVEQLLADAQLSYDIHVVPWARAYNTVKTTPNTLIYSMNRTAEREPYFFWIKRLGQIGNSFISLSNNKQNLSSIADAKNYVTAAVRDGYAYELLIELGFTIDKNLFVVATLEQQISLLLNGKIDFLFTDIQSVKLALAAQQLDPAMVSISYSEPTWIHDLYLAANIDSDPELLQQIGKVYSAQLP